MTKIIIVEIYYLCDNNALFLLKLGRKQQSISVQNLFELSYQPESADNWRFKAFRFQNFRGSAAFGARKSYPFH